MKNSNIKRTILYILIVFVSVALLSILFYPRNNYNDDTTDPISGNKLLGEETNSIDVIFVGNSQAYTSINPKVIKEYSGISSYVTAIAAQPACETVEFVKAAFLNQKPSLIVIEADIIYEDCSMAKYAYTKLKNYIPILQYHDRWKKIGTNEFSLKENFTDKDINLGYNNDDTVEGPNWETAGYMNNDFDGSYINKSVELSIMDISKLCKENDAKLLIISTPNLEWSYARCENVQALADKCGADYLDLNDNSEMGTIDWKTMSKDYGVHLNNAGADIVSEYIAEFLKEYLN